MTPRDADADNVYISALQHYLYCPRQFALIHVEQYWQESYLTASGRQLHARVDLPGRRSDPGRSVAYALPLNAPRLGVSGVADAVEFHAATARKPRTVLPVEYKRGHDKISDCDRVQLCAQALALEEMMGVAIADGALFYFETRERVPVELDDALRQTTQDTIRACREILRTGQTPLMRYEAKRCRACSLRDYCMPPREIASVKPYFDEAML